jgi:glycosyltransferase involved in cell wall biosynthesis
VRVLHCVPSLAGGGAERQLTYLAKELAQLGWDVHVAYVHGGPNMRRLEQTGATLHQLTAWGNYDPQILWRLWRTIRKVEPDIVQCWLLQMEVLGGLVAVATRLPWVFSERSCEEAYPPGVKTWLRRGMGLRASAIVSNSAGGERYWRAQARRQLRCHIIRNGLPLEEIAKAPIATLEEAGAAPGRPLVLSAGRFGPEKNFEAVVRAIGLAVLSHPIQAIVCGDGPLRSRIEELVAETGLSDRVRSVGYAANLWSLMKRANLTVSVSWFEGTPNVVLEAMACGCPLVVSDIAAHREFLDEQAAILVDPRDSRQIADAMIEVLDDPEAAARRARVAYDRVQRYSVSAIAREYADLYQELADSRRRGVTRVAL